MRPDSVLDYYGKWFSTSRTAAGLLEVGHSGPHVANIILGLRELRYHPPSGDTFTPALASEVERFQEDMHHKRPDGRVGRGTRRLLVDELLEREGGRFFREDLKPTFPSFHRVFLSYAWADSARVDLLDQWLRDHGLSVSRDIRDFEAGQELQDEITTNLNFSDRAVAVVTASSRVRDWPTFERFVAAKIEELRGERCLIYLLLDNAEPPKHDSGRINVVGTGRPLKEIGEAILRSVTGSGANPPTYVYDDTRTM